MKNLDRWLTDIANAFGKMLLELLIIVFPLLVVEQACIWATNIFSK